MEDYKKKVEELRKQTKLIVEKLDEEKKIKEQEDKDSARVLETFSKIYVKAPPEVPMESLGKLMQQRKFVNIKYVQQIITADAQLSQDWVTIGVLASKSEVRKSKIGSNYMILTLSDLESTEIKVFLFADAYENWWKEPCGSLLAVLNALPNAGGTGPLSYKVEKASKLMKVGSAADYGRCAGIDGINRCEGYVNLKHGNICGKHSRPKIRTLRPELATLQIKKIQRKGEKMPLEVKKFPRHVFEPTPSEFSALYLLYSDRYLANRNKMSKEYGKNVEIEVNLESSKK